MQPSASDWTFPPSFFTQVINGIPDPIFVKNRQHQWVFLNDAFCEFLGNSRELLLGKSDYDFFPKAQADVFWAQDELVFNTGVTHENEEDFSNVRGETYLVATKKSLFQDDSGNTLLIGTIRDITERKRSEDERQRAKKELELSVEARTTELQQLVAQLQQEMRDREASEERFRAIFENSGMGIAVIGPDLKFRQTNSCWQQLLGYSATELPDITPQNLTLPEDWRIEQRLALDCVTGRRDGFQRERQLLRADGTLVWANLTVSAIRDSAGQFQFFVVMVQDISDRKHVEAERDRFFTLAADMLCIAGSDGYFKRVNPAFETTLGYTTEELLAQPFVDLVHPDDQAATIAEASKLSAGVETVAFENRYRCKDGSYRWLSWTSTPYVQEGLIYATARDITERKQTEEALKASEAQYRDLVQTANCIILRWDTTGTIRFINEFGTRFFGFETVELIGENVIGTIVPKTETSGRDLQALMADIHLHPEKYAHNENENLCKDGRRVWIAWANKPILTAQGELVEVLSVGTDATERKRTEEALRRSQKRYATLAAAVPVGIFRMDIQGSLVYVNERWCEIAGMTPAQAKGNGWYQAIHPEDLERVLAEAQRAGQAYTPFRLEYRFQRPDGLTTWVFGQALAEYDLNGQVIGYVGTITDISDRKHAEAQLQQQATDLEQAFQELQRTQAKMVQSEKMSSLGQLVAGVAHEINNPVNFIYGNLSHARTYTQDLLGLVQLYQQHYPAPVAAVQAEAEAIDLEFLMDDLPKLMDSMQVGAERIQKIVASLRTFSRMDEAEMKAVDLHEGIESTLMILQNRLKAKSDRTEIGVVKQYGELPRVECYAGQLNQVFMNVLSNAIDALEDAVEQQADLVPVIRIQTEVTPDHQIAIRIADNGPGIPDAIKRRLFDPFFTTKPVGKGTGMGLSISYQIVTEKHGGSLSCSSEPGQGSEFVITIPLSPT